MGIVSPSPEELKQNTIAFGVPSAIFFIMRILNSGWVLRKLRLEDYLMMVTFCFYVSLLTFINLSASYASNLYPAAQEAAILANPTDVHDRIYGSKLVIPLEQSMLLSTWGVKTCIWLFLRRLCRQLPRFQIALTVLIFYTWFGYLFIQVCYYFIFCRPFQQYWAVPVHNQQCATYAHYSYVQMVWNITSDIGLIVIPLCMFSIARLPLKRKIVLMAVFSMAFFTILAAILNKVYNFLSPMTTTYQLWYIREASVAIWVGNLICCWQLFQKLFKVRSFDNKSDLIIAQPEMGRHRLSLHPSQFSAGGSPKTDSWWAHQRQRIASYLTKASRSYTSQPSYVNRHKGTGTNQTATTPGTGTENGNMIGDTDQSQTAYAAHLDTLMSLNKDGDDAGPAIAYRHQEDIV